MAQRHWWPRGMSDRGCDTSRTEADAVLTPCQTQGEMLMTFSFKHWGYIARETLMTLYLTGHYQAWRQLVKSHSRVTRCYDAILNVWRQLRTENVWQLKAYVQLTGSTMTIWKCFTGASPVQVFPFEHLATSCLFSLSVKQEHGFVCGGQLNRNV